MKQLEISVESRIGGLQRKTLAFPITEEMARHIGNLHEEMAARLSEGDVNSDPTVGFAIEGSKRLSIGLSVMDTSIRF